MDAIAYARLRPRLAAVLDRVCDDREPLIVTRRAGPSVVPASLDDYRALEKTAAQPRGEASAGHPVPAAARLDPDRGPAL